MPTKNFVSKRTTQTRAQCADCIQWSRSVSLVDLFCVLLSEYLHRTEQVSDTWRQLLMTEVKPLLERLQRGCWSNLFSRVVPVPNNSEEDWKTFKCQCLHWLYLTFDCYFHVLDQMTTMLNCEECQEAGSQFYISTSYIRPSFCLPTLQIPAAFNQPSNYLIQSGNTYI